MAGDLMAHDAVGGFVNEALVHCSNHRFLSVIHFSKIVAAAAVSEVVAGHCVDHSLGEFSTFFEPHLRCVESAAKFAETGNGTGFSFCEKPEGVRACWPCFQA